MTMLAVMIPSAACHAAGPPEECRVNWARWELGARLLEAPEAHDVTGIENLLMQPVDGRRRGSGHTIFADRPQRERFVVDLGQSRVIGRIFIGSHPASDQRHPDTVTIRGSTEGPDGPWETLVDAGDIRAKHTFILENTPVRLIEFVLGECTDQRGSRITSLGAFTRWQLPDAGGIAQWLAGKYDPDAEGLQAFRRAAESGKWRQAAKALRRYYAARLEPYEGPTPERSTGIAQDLLEHRFQFGEPVHAFGPDITDIDWAYELDYEWTNSLNRCGFWTHTANVYRATEDARYIDEIEGQLLHWIETCPLPPKPDDGRWRSWQTWDRPALITWRSLDSAIRLWKLTALVPLMCAERTRVSDRACMALLWSIWEHLDYLSDDDWDGGNWLSTVNASALDAAVAHGEFGDSPQWLEHSKAAFELNVLRDVRADGKEIENSPGYIQFAYQSMFRVLQTLTERGVEVDPEAYRRLDLLQDFIAWTAFPDGTVPMIGDSDRGGVGILDRTWPYFEREDIRYVATAGVEGTPPGQASRYWEDSGWCVMRGPWGEGEFRDALHLVFKASPRGPHGHLDQNSLTLYAYGRPLLIDPGRLNYRAEGVLFRSTPMHNTIAVDDADQAGGDAAFERWESAPEHDLAVGSHQLYQGVTHQRSVGFVKPGFVVVKDSLASEEAHRYAQRWHFPEGAAPEEIDGAVTTRFNDGANLLVVPLGDVAASRSEDYDIAYGWDERVSAKAWVYELGGTGLVTLLIPYRGSTPPTVKAREASGVVELTMDDITWRVDIGETVSITH